MEKREMVVEMINEINGGINNCKNTPKEEEIFVIGVIRKYRKNGVSKFEVVESLNDISFKYHSTFIALWNTTLE